MAQDINNLIWIDMEMSGLSPQTDRILEVALVITEFRAGYHRGSAGAGDIPAGGSAGCHGQLE